MRSTDSTFAKKLSRSTKNLRLAIHIDIDAGIWLTSHDDIDLGAVGGTVVDNCIEGVSSTSQKLNASAGRAEIGSITFEVTDIGAGFSIALRDALVNGYGLNGKTVKLYRGFEGLTFADYRLEQTQQVHKTVSYKDGGYKVQCADIQRQMRKEVFDPAKTILTADAAKDATTIEVATTAGFEPCTHLPCFKEADGSGAFYYFKIKYKNGFEIIRATGKTDASFTGCTRARFGTKAQAHTVPADTGADQGVQVEEYIYLEMPAPMLAYAVLTGDYYDAGGTKHTLPASWHLGIDTAHVNYSEFSDIGRDWYEPENPDNGVVLRFDGMGKQDGKAFIERQICLLLGAFMPIRSDGRVGFDRLAPVLRTSTAVAELNGNNIVSYSELRQDLDGMHNLLDITWARIHVPGEDKPRYLRRNIFKDQISTAVNGEGQPLKLVFDGLHNARHTKSTLFGRFDALRDRYTHPPFSLDLKLLPSAANLEVGDVVRVKLNILRDYTTGTGLDRAFEVQQVTVDQVSGLVSVKLFGASFRSEPIADNPTEGAAGAPVLLDSWYSSEGANLDSVLSVAGGILQADGSLPAGVYFYSNDFTIPAGRTLTISGTVELRIMGHLQVDGEIEGRGRGKASGIPGYFGNTVGGAGLSGGTYRDTLEDERVIYLKHTFPGGVTKGKHSTLPAFSLDNPDGNLFGLPSGLEGSGGAAGGTVVPEDNLDFNAAGGAGGAGGAGLVIVSRGMAFGLSGKIDVSGADGALGESKGVETLWTNPWTGVPGYNGTIEEGGGGAGGAPGGLFVVIDGNSSTVPIFNGKVENVNGASPESPELEKQAGSSLANVDDAGYRWVYAPQPRVPFQEPEGEGSISWADIVNDGNKPEDNANFVDNTNQLTDGAGLGKYAELLENLMPPGTFTGALSVTVTDIYDPYRAGQGGPYGCPAIANQDQQPGGGYFSKGQ